jgi:hypothetical protein
MAHLPHALHIAPRLPQKIQSLSVFAPPFLAVSPNSFFTYCFTSVVVTHSYLFLFPDIAPGDAAGVPACTPAFIAAAPVFHQADSL